MKRVLHIVLSCFYIEGLSYQENLLPKYHSLLGFDTWVLTSSFPNSNLGDTEYLNLKEYINRDNVHVIKLKRKEKKLFGRDISFNSFFNVYESIQRISPDIIFVHGLTSTANREIAKYIRKHPNVTLYADQHGDFYNTPYNTWKQKALTKIVWLPKINCLKKYVKVFFGTTPWRCEYLNKVYKIAQNKIRLLQMGFDTYFYEANILSIPKKELYKKYNITENDFVIISGGKIDKSKNIHLLIKAFKTIHSKNAKLILFGTIKDDIKKQLLKEISEDERIIYLGWLHAKQIMEVLSLATISVFPGTHSVLWEQVCGCGIPSVFNFWDGMRHLNVNGNCIFINGESVDEISKILYKLISEEDFYLKMKDKANEAKYNFSYESIAKKALEMENGDSKL